MADLKTRDMLLTSWRIQRQSLDKRIELIRRKVRLGEVVTGHKYREAVRGLHEVEQKLEALDGSVQLAAPIPFRPQLVGLSAQDRFSQEWEPFGSFPARSETLSIARAA
jgi:hypothetical protein